MENRFFTKHDKQNCPNLQDIQQYYGNLTQRDRKSVETVLVWDRDAKRKEFKNWTKNKKSQLKCRHKQK